MIRFGLAFVTGALVCHAVLAGDDGQDRILPALVPQPASMKILDRTFTLKPNVTMHVRTSKDTDEPSEPARHLAQWLRQRTGYAIPIEQTRQTAPSSHETILLMHALGQATVPRQFESEEEYELLVEQRYVMLEAKTSRGLLRGIQTFRQLFPPWFEIATKAPLVEGIKLPCVLIKDSPRYPWRGSMLDCCRHFMTKEFVKRYIDLLAYHKMNVLHWHLTEDQGWRIEIKRYPKLTEIGAWRGEGKDRYGGYYSQDDIREVVAYAESRGVTIVPEIEMPGHSGAALAGYPELSCTGGPFKVSTKWGVHKDVYCAGNEKTFEFLENVLTEVIELFPSKFIHIGGDECPKDRWKECPKCQARIRSEGLKDEHELQSYFVRRAERFLNAHGRRLVGWDEILEGGLAPNATVQSWRGMEGAVAAATSGHDVVASPTSHCYLDYPQVADPETPGWMGMITLERIYSFEPTPPGLTAAQAQHILGAEGNIWTEHAPQDRIDHQVFPRLCALAEVTWSPKASRHWSDFERRMKTHYQRLDALGVSYFRKPD